MKKRLISVAVLILAVFSATVVVYLVAPQILPFFRKAPIVIAVAGPFSGSLRSEGVAMLRGAQLAADAINQNGGIDGRMIRLQQFDDRNQPQQATRTATDISAGNDVLMVLGHYGDVASLMAGRIYRKNGIPAITASAPLDQVTRDNQWYFRTSANNSLQGGFIATYAARSMDKKSATIIYTDDFHGRGLAGSFEETAKEIGMEIKKKWSISLDYREQGRDIEKIAANVRSMADPGIVLVAAQGEAAVETIAALKASGAKYDIIGGISFASPSFARAFNRYPREKAVPGYYTNGLYAVSPFQPELAGERGRVFGRAYEKRYGEPPPYLAVCYYDAMKTAGEAMSLIGMDSDAGGIRRHRKETREALENLHLPEIGVKGARGIIYFDENGDFNGPLAVGQYDNGRFSPLFIQYQHIEGRQASAGDLGRILSGEIILVENKPMIKTQLVFTGVEVRRIWELAPLNSTFVADFNLWFRFQGDFDPAAIQFTNAVKPIDLGPPLVASDADNGVAFRSYSVASGLFKARFDFRDYPFDRQSLAIRFRHENLTREQIIYVPDRFQPETPVKDSTVGLDALDAATGWRAAGSRGFQKSVGNEESPAVLELLSGKSAPTYSEFNFETEIRKQGGQIFFKHLFPLILLVITAYSIFFIPGSYLMIRVVLGGAIILSAATYHAAHLFRLPAAYVTTLEWAIYGVYGLTCAAVFLSFFMLKSDECGDIQALGRVKRLGLIGYPIVTAILTAAILGRHLWG